MFLCQQLHWCVNWHHILWSFWNQVRALEKKKSQTNLTLKSNCWQTIGTIEHSGTQLVRQNSEVLLVLGPCPHESGHNYLIIETTYFLSGFVWTGPLNRPGERFQNNAVSVSGFTGFVWTEGRFVSYLYVVTQRSSPQTAFVWRSVAWRLKERLCSRLTRTRNYWNTSFSHNLSLCYFIYSLCAVV